MKRTTVAIVGTAGRDGSSSLDRGLFEKMCKKAVDIITLDWKLDWNSVQLVSGGAAWSDHVAVNLFITNTAQALTLYLPCPLVKENGTDYKFQDNKNSKWFLNPGRSANAYHEAFSSKMGISSCNQIHDAETNGAVLDTSSLGFHDRNSKVAKSDYMIAFTFGESSPPDSGGTADTWKKAGKYQCKRSHVSLNTLQQTPFKKRANQDSTIENQAKRLKK